MFYAVETDAAPAEPEVSSQAIKSGHWVFLSGQIPLVAQTNTLIEGSISEQTAQVFHNLNTVAMASGGSLEHIVKLTIYLKNLDNLPEFNQEMVKHFTAPLPARAVVSVQALPMNAQMEVEAIMMVQDPAWSLAIT